MAFTFCRTIPRLVTQLEAYQYDNRRIFQEMMGEKRFHPNTIPLFIRERVWPNQDTTKLDVIIRSHKAKINDTEELIRVLKGFNKNC